MPPSEVKQWKEREKVKKKIIIKSCKSDFCLELVQIILRPPPRFIIFIVMSVEMSPVTWAFFSKRAKQRLSNVLFMPAGDSQVPLETCMF